MRSRAGDRKPGACTTKHPWKAKDVPGRLDELRQDLSRVRREISARDEKQYEEAVAVWAGNLSETWERIFSQEIVGPVLAEGGLEVRPMMVKVLARFSDEDHREFDGSYGGLRSGRNGTTRALPSTMSPPTSTSSRKSFGWSRAGSSVSRDTRHDCRPQALSRDEGLRRAVAGGGAGALGGVAESRGLQRGQRTRSPRTCGAFGPSISE